jgi:hypothetical protein
VGVRPQRKRSPAHPDVRRAVTARDRPDEFALLALQRSAGNAAVTRALQRFKAPSDPDAADAAFILAVSQHRAQTAVLKGWLEAGRQQNEDERLKNACDWIAQGNSKLYAVTPTGDAHERLTHAQKSPETERAYFPKVVNAAGPGHILNPAGGDYNPKDLEDNANVQFVATKTGAWNTATALPSGIAVPGVPTATGYTAWMFNVTEDPISQEKFFAHVKHEVQHAADRSQDKFTAIGATLEETKVEGVAGMRVTEALRTGKPVDGADLVLLPADFRRAVTAFQAAKEAGNEPEPADIKVLNDFLPAKSRMVDEITSLASLEKYKTEYRAYSYEGSFDDLDNHAVYDPGQPGFVVPGEHWTERQWSIFSTIHDDYAHTSNG